jgi:glucan phosphorylase
VQIVLPAAHCRTTKPRVQLLFGAKGSPHVGERIAYLHDYDRRWRVPVTGCDLWFNQLRPPLGGERTSVMKAALNGASTERVDGWWAEGFDGATAGRSTAVRMRTAKRRCATRDDAARADGARARPLFTNATRPLPAAG